MQLLHIDSSVLGGNSASRALSAEIVAKAPIAERSTRPLPNSLPVRPKSA
jgi:FMN-dependent NADH-azoreductase